MSVKSGHVLVTLVDMLYNAHCEVNFMKLYELFPTEEFEDLNLECKTVLNKEEDKKEKWAKSLSAFSNSGEGHIFVGVDDDLNIFGLTRKEIDSTKNLVLLTIDRHIFPHIKVFFNTIDLKNDKFLLDIFVPSSSEIVCLRMGDYNEKVFIRENGSSVPANVSQILALGKRKFGSDVRIMDKSFEKKNYSKFLSLAKKYRKDGLEPTKEDLISLDVLANDGRVKEGLYMFSDEFSSDESLLVCRLWNGYEKGVSEAIDKKEFKGPLGEVFLDALNFVKRNSSSGFIKLEDGSRLDTYAYPELALRELIVNAIAHRDYSIPHTQIDIDIYKDRLEISSPGSWLLASSPEQYSLYKIPSIRRNKIICGCFEAAGLMEQSASGLKKVANLYKYYPEKTPFLDNEKDYFCVTLYNLLFDEKNEMVVKDKNEQEVIAFCKGIARTREEIQNHLNVQSRTYLTSHILKPLIEKGLLKRTAPSKSPNVKYIA